MASAQNAKRTQRMGRSEEARKSQDVSDIQAAGNNDPREQSSGKDKDNGTSWYIRPWAGNSSSKAKPVTEVARESISVGNPVVVAQSSLSVSTPSKSPRSSSMDLTKKLSGSTRSPPAVAATTRINIASNGSSTSKLEDGDTLDRNKDKNGQENDDNGVRDVKADSGTSKPENVVTISTTEEAITTETSQGDQGGPRHSQGWLDWLSLTRAQGNEIISSNGADTEEIPPKIPSDDPNDDSRVVNSNTLEGEIRTGQDTTVMTQTSQKRTWLQMWAGGSATAATQTKHTSQIIPLGIHQPPERLEPLNSHEDVVSSEEKTKTDGENAEAPERPSSWLFWSRQIPDTNTREPVSEPDTSLETQQPGVEAPSASTPSPGKKSKTQLDHEQSPNTPKNESQPKPERSSPVSRKKAQQDHPKNQVLPSFETSFPDEGKPGIIHQLGRLIYSVKGSEAKHVYRSKHPPTIKKAVAIGIHGYFPAPLIRTVLGQPTGTSIKFATMSAKAIEEWAKIHKSHCIIDKIVLEGDGRIGDRVELLWKLLLEWIGVIREADFIMISCHSQGVPVATMLVSKLIAFGCVNAARIGICAMAGVNMGPFPDYRSRWISGSAGELFDFANEGSKVSKDYMAALKLVLNHGVRIVYVGSIDDQLVSLESSTFGVISHPHIYRAVFVDGRVHAPSFLSHLVGFAMKLRNLGVSDHGLIRELSSPLAGSLYSGEGHSRVYDDADVYRLSVRYILETTTVNNATLEIFKPNLPTGSNPYILPFAMRGLLEEEYVRKELSEETTELLNQFEDWNPSTKVLKDVKFRLEGIRSKL